MIKLLIFFISIIIFSIISYNTFGPLLERHIYKNNIETDLKNLNNRIYTVIRVYDPIEYEKQIDQFIEIKKIQKNLNHQQITQLYGNQGSKLTKKYLPYASSELLFESTINELNFYKELIKISPVLFMKYLIPNENTPSFDDMKRLKELTVQYKIDDYTNRLIISGIHKEFTKNYSGAIEHNNFLESLKVHYPQQIEHFTKRKKF